MAVAHAGASTLSGFTTADPHNFFYTPAGTARGLLLVITATGTSADQIVGVTYGGVAMSRVAFAQDTAGEQGAAWAYFLGLGIPGPGEQTVSISTTGTAGNKRATLFEISGDADTEVVASAVSENDQANPQAALDSGSRTAIRYAALFSGHDDLANLANLSGMTTVNDTDIGVVVMLHDRQTSPSSGSFTVGWTAASDDVAAVYVAIAEVVTGIGHEQTITDSLGLGDTGQGALILDAEFELQLSDLVDVVVAYDRVSIDALGLTDSIEVFAAHDRTVLNALELLDSISQDLTGGGGEHAQSVTDGLGLVDTGAADLYTPADVLGLSDSVVVDYVPGAVERTVTDDLGLVDQGTGNLIIQGQSFDLLSLEDSGQADLYASADPLGLVDQITVDIEFGRVLDESLGLSDSISQELTAAGEERTVTDTVGLTDSGSVDQVADQLGLTDFLLVALNPIDAGASDNLGLEDSGSSDLLGDADFLGFVDSLVIEFSGSGFTATVDDALGLTDQIAVATSKVLETTDALGLVDSGTADRLGNADLLGITDSVTAEIAGAGEAVVTDPLGLLDTTAQEMVIQRSHTDDLGLLDSAVQELSTERSQTDPLGLLDTATAESQSVKDQTDDLGLTDSVTVELIGAGEALITEPLGLTDTGTGLFEGDADFLGLTDTVFYATGGAESRTVDDLLGLTDTATGVSDAQRAVTDALGLTDSTETVSAVVRTVTDVLGLTDDASTTTTLAQTQTANLGLTDSLVVELTGVDQVTKTELLGLTDTAARVSETSRTQTDNLGLSDSIDVVLIGQLISVSITDLVGLVDDVDRAGGHQRFADDPLGLVDAVTKAIDYRPELIDLLGLTDSITRQISGPDFWKPWPVPYTRNPVPYTKAPVAYVPVGPGDTPPWN